MHRIIRIGRTGSVTVFLLSLVSIFPLFLVTGLADSFEASGLSLPPLLFITLVVSALSLVSSLVFSILEYFVERGKNQ
jgi:hypothetical protein